MDTEASLPPINDLAPRASRPHRTGASHHRL